MICNYCQSELVASARICKHCGHPVYSNPDLEDLYFSRLSSNAPPTFVKKVRSAPYLAKEHRTVTAILFTIANRNEFVENVPEDARTPILNDALDRFARIIFEYEGTIAKLWENTVLAFFGAPISHEDDPLRAVHAAQTILEKVKEISAEVDADFGIPLRLKMILNSGPIVIGDIKSNLKFEFYSLDNTLECMDLAVRGAIPPCEVILLDDTYRFIKPFVKCEKLEDIVCEEIGSSLHLWRLDHITNGNNHLQRLSLSPQSNFIGREKELDQLMELTETVLAGLGRVGLISGEPGIGKSRLVMEWKHKLGSLHQPTKIRWIEAHGSAFGRELAYHLMKDLIRSTLKVPETHSKDELRKSLLDTLDDLMDANQETLFLYLAHLLEIPLSDEQENRIHKLSASELRTQYLSAIQSFLKNFAIEQPLIILLEDLHWADASSIDLLIELLPMTGAYPILFCLVARPDRESSGWRLVTLAREHFGPRLTSIDLDHLDEKESQTFIKQLMGIDQIPEVINDIVLGKSEGNPFFIEELIRMLVNEGVLTQISERWVLSPDIDITKIPNSLQGLLTARIDRLPPDARLTLRVASVIGRDFSDSVLENVMADRAPDVELLEQLSTLESIGMVKVAQVQPELIYTFQHILLHDAAYQSIYQADRRELHLLVGQTLEKLYPDKKEIFASQLAQHFNSGGNKEKALEYFDMAGHVSMEAFASAEAENYYQKAVQLSEDPEKLAHLYSDLGEALAQQSKHRRAIQAWDKAIQYLQQLDETDRLARVFAWSARSAWWGYDPKRSLEICEQGLKAVENAVESPDIAYLVHETGRAYLFNNQPEKAQAYCEQALEMAKRLDAVDVQAEALATMGILPTLKPQQAIAALEKAVEISESNNLFGSASRAYINLAAVIDHLGEIRLARDYQKRAIQLGNKAGGVSDEMFINLSIARASLWLADFSDVKKLIDKIRRIPRQNDAYLDEDTLNLLYLEGLLSRYQGDFSNALESFSDVVDRSRQINDQDRVKQARLAMAEMILEPHLLEEKNANFSNLDIALNIITDVVHKAESMPSPLDVTAQCLLSNVHALRGNLAKAEEALEVALDYYQKQPVMQDRVKIVLAQARLEAAQNHYEEALSHYNDCIAMLERMEGRWWQARVLLEIGIISLRHNDPEDVDQAQNIFRETLSEFKEMGVDYYPEVTIDKLRQVKRISRAQAIAHRKITQELAEAGRVQHTFMPTQSPNMPGYDISGVILPARETSGDFYDFITLDDRKLGIVIADVGDKGAGAALYMAISRTLIRTYAREKKLLPHEVIHQINRRILEDTQRGIFLTVIFGVLDPESGSFSYVNAGHNPPYLLKKEGDQFSYKPLTKTGTLVGIFADNTWETQQVDIATGEALVLFTDGITEAQDESEDFFGDERLMNSLEKNFSLDAEAYRNAILENVQAFSGAAPRLDDITLIVITRDSES